MLLELLLCPYLFLNFTMTNSSYQTMTFLLLIITCSSLLLLLLLLKKINFIIITVLQKNIFFNNIFFNIINKILQPAVCHQKKRRQPAISKRNSYDYKTSGVSHFFFGYADGAWGFP